MRCQKCGNENAGENRFCGMCGVALLKPAPWPAVPGRPRSDSATLTPDVPAASYGKETGRPSSPISQPPFPKSRQPASELDDAPIITGPSFLGLNQPSSRAGLGRNGPAEVSRPRAETRHDHLAYLLEDEEIHSKRNWIKPLLIAIAVALVAALFYIRWKQGGLPWVQSSKSSDVQPLPDSTQNSADTASAKTTPAPSPETGTTPHTGDGENDSAGSSITRKSSPTETAGDGAAAPDIPAHRQTNGAEAPPDGPSNTAPQQALERDTSVAVASPPPTRTHSKGFPPPSKPAAGRKPEPHRSPPSSGAKAAPPDTVAESQRFLYGRGVRQDCDRGLQLLKPATQSSAPAMIAMGTLYSTGTCTPHDLPTAYRWFALALHKEPNNQALQDELQRLWSRMTQPERQLAIKLSR